MTSEMKISIRTLSEAELSGTISVSMHKSFRQILGNDKVVLVIPDPDNHRVIIKPAKAFLEGVV